MVLNFPIPQNGSSYSSRASYSGGRGGIYGHFRVMEVVGLVTGTQLSAKCQLCHKSGQAAETILLGGEGFEEQGMGKGG